MARGESRIIEVALGLYVHIPFCSAICNDGNFHRGLFDADLKERYVDALITELGQQRLRPCLAEEPSFIRGEASASVRAGGGAPAPVKK